MKRSNGEGTNFKRKDGRWCGAFYDDSPNPKRHFVYGSTQTEVKKKLKEKRENSKIQQDSKTKELSEIQENFEISIEEKEDSNILEEWLYYYLENYKKNEIKETTYGTYLELYRKHIKGSNVGKSDMNVLTSNQLQKYYNSKKAEGYNPKTIKHIYTLINSALNKAVQLKIIKENVNKLVILPKKEIYQAKVLSAEEVRKILIEAKEDTLYPIVVLTLYTGLRKGEVMALKWENINFDTKELYVEGSLCRVIKEVQENGKTIHEYKILAPKTVKSKRVIPLVDIAVEALQIQKQRQDIEKEKIKLFIMMMDLYLHDMMEDI